MWTLNDPNEAGIPKPNPFVQLLKYPFKIFGMAFFAIVSFVTLLFLFSLFFVAMGFGVGSSFSKKDIKKDLKEFAVEESDYLYVSGKKESKNYLLSVPIEGLILGSPSLEMGAAAGWMGVTYGYEIQEQLKNAAKDSNIKGVFLHMQTPGGTIFGSMAVFEAVKAYQKSTKKPVLAYIEGLSASGGVMAMSGADAIYADYGSMIGSIGVIGGMLTYFDKPVATEGGLMGGGIVTQGGIENTIISAGRSKDLGNPFRKPTEEELQILKSNIQNEYDLFVRHVAQSRKMEEKTIREDMGAQIFDNRTAQKYGLIDGTLNKEGALSKLAELAHVPKDFQLVRPKKDRRRFLQELLFSLYKTDSREKPIREAIHQDICTAVTSLPMVYHGDLTRLCAGCKTGTIY